MRDARELPQLKNNSKNRACADVGNPEQISLELCLKDNRQGDNRNIIGSAGAYPFEPKRVCGPRNRNYLVMCSCACSAIASNGLCAGGWRHCCSRISLQRVTGPGEPHRSERLRFPTGSRSRPKLDPCRRDFRFIDSGCCLTICPAQC